MKNIRLSVDDGCASDLRVAELAKKYKIKATFYWPVEWHSLACDKDYEPLSFKDAEMIAQEFEIGSHTITHRHLTKIPVDEAKFEIAESQRILGRLFNKSITKFCPPRGYTNQELTEYTLGHYNSQRLTKGKGLVHIHPNSGANNNMPWRDYAKTIQVKEIWGHSWEFDKYELWEELEEFLSEAAYS